MKIAVITDQHFGARKGSKFLHDYFKKFYDEIFFPYLEENNIKVVIDMGDTFDNRRSIDLWSLEWAKENYYNHLRDLGITIHTIVGNHTAYYKNTNDVNSVGLLLREYDNVKIYSETTEVQFDKLKTLFIPWINQENQEKTFNFINNTKCKIAFGHLELNGFRAHRGPVMEDGELTFISTTLFKILIIKTNHIFIFNFCHCNNFFHMHDKEIIGSKLDPWFNL